MTTSKLEENTLNYWSMSLCWNGRQKKDQKIPTIMEALKSTNSILGTTNPNRLLSRCVAVLQHEVIHKPDKPKRVAAGK